MVALMGGAGTTHFTNPGFYDPIVPDWMPGSARAWTYVSGAVYLLAKKEPNFAAEAQQAGAEFNAALDQIRSFATMTTPVMNAALPAYTS